jgi:hypothetical protein
MTNRHICIVLVVVLTSRKISIIRSHVRNVSVKSVYILRFYWIRLITKLPNSEQSYKGKVKTHKYINRNVLLAKREGNKMSSVFESKLYKVIRQKGSYLWNRLLDQGYSKIRLIRSLKKFIFRYQDIVEIYSVSAEKIINDGFSYSENV